MEWLKQHADTIVILSMFAICFWTLNERMNDRNDKMTDKLSTIEKDIAVVKTVLVMKNIMCQELATKEKVNDPR